MLFNSLEFFFFFPTVTILYFALAHRYRWMLLLLASCLFYMALIPQYILILAFLIAVDYTAGIAIEAARGNTRRWLLAGSIVANVGILFAFKYFNFFNANMSQLAALIGWNYPVQYLTIILPVGLSFHTFQSMSYTIEVYRGKQAAERHPGIYALYVMFYPQLVAGPIERPQNLLHQFREERAFDYERVAGGLRLMTWGLFKKVVIADRLAVVVNQVYGDPYRYEGAALVIATLFFAFQIYCDFSGYSDIAIGAAQVMGFRLMRNFNSPYLSKSVGEFWRRWHISLSTWFRDYVYIPLGGSRVSEWRRRINLLVVFAVSGLWHGASWNFVIWGVLHGIYLILEIAAEGLKARVPFIGRLTTFSRMNLIPTIATFFLVSLAWVFFRANNVDQAIYIITHLFANPGSFSPASLRDAVQALGLGDIQFPLSVLSVVALVLLEAVQSRQDIGKALTRQPAWVRWGIYYAAVVCILAFGVFNKSRFIYFQF